MSFLPHRISFDSGGSLSGMKVAQSFASSYKKALKIFRKTGRKVNPQEVIVYSTIIPSRPPPQYYALNYNDKFVIEKMKYNSGCLFRLYLDVVNYRQKKKSTLQQPSSQSKPRVTTEKKKYRRFSPVLFVIDEEEETQPMFERPSNPAGFDKPSRSPLSCYPAEDNEDDEDCVPKGLNQPTIHSVLASTLPPSYPPRARRPSLQETAEENFNRIKRMTMEPINRDSFRARVDKVIVMTVLGIFFCFFFTHTLSIVLAFMAHASESSDDTHRIVDDIELIHEGEDLFEAYETD